MTAARAETPSPTPTAGAETTSEPEVKLLAIGCTAYKYEGTNESLCGDFPGTVDRDCPDIKFQVRLVGLNDPWNLDNGDIKGLGCENYPKKGINPQPTKKPTPKATKTTEAGPTGPELPRTGSSMPYLVGAGVIVLVAGGILAFAFRTRKYRIES